MPTFAPGASKTAVLPVRILPSGAATNGELYLAQAGVRKATSGSRVLPTTGAQTNVSFPIVMPSVAGTYDVGFDILIGTQLFATYGGFEAVTLAAVDVGLTITGLSFVYAYSGESGVTTYNWYTVQISLKNNGSAVSSHIVAVQSKNSTLGDTFYNTPLISELNRVSLNPGQTGIITLRNPDGSSYMVNNLTKLVSGYSITVRARALLNGDINSFSSEMVRTL